MYQMTVSLEKVAMWNKKNEIDVWDLEWTEIYILALPILNNSFENSVLIFSFVCYFSKTNHPSCLQPRPHHVNFFQTILSAI